MDYKAQTTLNEKDSISDLLIVEKALVKLYATAITEGVSKGFRQTVRECLNGQIEDQIDVYFFLTDYGYERVCSATEECRNEVKDAFSKSKGELA